MTRCKKVNVITVAGGPLFTAAPDNYSDVNHLVLQETKTEITLPPFLEDLALGKACQVYTSDIFPDLEDPDSSLEASQDETIFLHEYSIFPWLYSAVSFVILPLFTVTTHEATYTPGR